jgi:hypothetical protein
MRVGDAITGATSAARVRPCAGCKRRAETLNRIFDRPRTPARDRSRIAKQLAGSLTIGLCSLALRRQLNRAR